jgi:16S rRNA (cytidine1402-2'-O)-methyltransferase
VLDAGCVVSAVPGPAAFVMALVVSGFDTSRFVFEGFLPRSGRDRTARLEAIAAETRTIVLYEAPQRVQRTVSDLATACGNERGVAIARELTKLYEDVWRGSLGAAAEHVANTPPRGEYVIVVEGAPRRVEVTDEEIRAALSQALPGHSRKDAVAEVVARLEVPRRRVYDLALTAGRGEHHDH